MMADVLTCNLIVWSTFRRISRARLFSVDLRQSTADLRLTKSQGSTAKTRPPT
jgi:hypothetical protein